MFNRPRGVAFQGQANNQSVGNTYKGFKNGVDSPLPRAKEERHQYMSPLKMVACPLCYSKDYQDVRQHQISSCPSYHGFRRVKGVIDKSMRDLEVKSNPALFWRPEWEFDDHKWRTLMVHIPGLSPYAFLNDLDNTSTILTVMRAREGDAHHGKSVDELLKTADDNSGQKISGPWCTFINPVDEAMDDALDKPMDMFPEILHKYLMNYACRHITKAINGTAPAITPEDIKVIKEGLKYAVTDFGGGPYVSLLLDETLDNNIADYLLRVEARWSLETRTKIMSYARNHITLTTEIFYTDIRGYVTVKQTVLNEVLHSLTTGHGASTLTDDNKRDVLSYAKKHLADQFAKQFSFKDAGFDISEKQRVLREAIEMLDEKQTHLSLTPEQNRKVATYLATIWAKLDREERKTLQDILKNITKQVVVIRPSASTTVPLDPEAKKRLVNDIITSLGKPDGNITLNEDQQKKLAEYFLKMRGQWTTGVRRQVLECFKDSELGNLDPKDITYVCNRMLTYWRTKGSVVHDAMDLVPLLKTAFDQLTAKKVAQLLPNGVKQIVKNETDQQDNDNADDGGDAKQKLRQLESITAEEMQQLDTFSLKNIIDQFNMVWQEHPNFIPNDVFKVVLNNAPIAATVDLNDDAVLAVVIRVIHLWNQENEEDGPFKDSLPENLMRAVLQKATEYDIKTYSNTRMYKSLVNEILDKFSGETPVLADYLKGATLPHLEEYVDEQEMDKLKNKLYNNFKQDAGAKIEIIAGASEDDLNNHANKEVLDKIKKKPRTTLTSEDYLARATLPDLEKSVQKQVMIDLEQKLYEKWSKDNDVKIAIIAGATESDLASHAKPEVMDEIKASVRATFTVEESDVKKLGVKTVERILAEMKKTEVEDSLSSDNSGDGGSLPVGGGSNGNNGRQQIITPATQTQESVAGTDGMAPGAPNLSSDDNKRKRKASATTNITSDSVNGSSTSLNPATSSSFDKDSDSAPGVDSNGKPRKKKKNKSDSDSATGQDSNGKPRKKKKNKSHTRWDEDGKELTDTHLFTRVPKGASGN